MGGDVKVRFQVRLFSLSLIALICACSQGAKASPDSTKPASVQDQSVEPDSSVLDLHYSSPDEKVEPVRYAADRPVAKGPFAVPAGLRARVDFWKDIFAKYESTQVVVHHREFPQIVFGIIDLRSEFAAMGPVQFAKHKEAVQKRTVAQVRAEIEPLARGEAARTDFQRKVERVMQPVRGGTAKYRRLLDEDLVRTQSGIRDRYVEAVRRSLRYLPMMEHIFVNEYGLPKELTRLPFVESSFDYTAYSSVGAAGIWQFMPRTARAHSMKVGRVVDERRDPLKATHAAAQYLRSAYRSLGSWPLAITSYNHGVGGVRSKVRKAGTEDIVELVEHPTERYFGFASSNFYPEFLAAVEIYEDWRRYFPEVPEEAPLRLVTVPVRTPVSPQHVARQLNIPVDDLREANYALLDPVWRGAAKIPAGYELRVPARYQDRADRMIAPESSSAKTRVVPVAYSPNNAGEGHTVKRGETLASIAKRYNTTPQQLMDLNGLQQSQLKAGQTLKVRGAAPQRTVATESSVDADVSLASLKREATVVHDSGDTPKQKVSTPGAGFYTVKRGDTLASIAKKTGRSVDALKKANKLKGSVLSVGQRLAIP